MLHNPPLPGKTVASLVPALAPPLVVALIVPLLASLAILRSLRFLIPSSFIANFFLLAGFGMVVFVSAKGLASSGMSPSATRDLIRPATLPLFTGIVSSSFEGIGMVLPLEGEGEGGWVACGLVGGVTMMLTFV